MADKPTHLNDLETLLRTTVTQAAEAERRLGIEIQLKKKAEQQRDFWHALAVVYETCLKDQGRQP